MGQDLDKSHFLPWVDLPDNLDSFEHLMDLDREMSDRYGEFLRPISSFDQVPAGTTETSIHVEKVADGVRLRTLSAGFKIGAVPAKPQIETEN
jgi:hypothetical protein